MQETSPRPSCSDWTDHAWACGLEMKDDVLIDSGWLVCGICGKLMKKGDPNERRFIHRFIESPPLYGFINPPSPGPISSGDD
jgi:hypothetical protein